MPTDERETIAILPKCPGCRMFIIEQMRYYKFGKCWHWHCLMSALGICNIVTGEKEADDD